MGSRDEEEKQKQGTRPAARPAGSASVLSPVTSPPKQVQPPSGRKLPADPWSDFEPTGTASRAPSIADLRRVSGSTAELTPVAPTQALSKGPARGAAPGLAKRPAVVQSKFQASSFDDEERTQIDAVLGKVRGVERRADQEVPTAANEVYDGVTPAEAVSSTEPWMAVTAPLQSQEGRRSAPLYASVIDQFAAGHNPRYLPDPPAKPRAHLFVWDVSRAMGCEVPHFLGGKEMSLLETVDWIRREAPMRGWRRLDAGRATAAAERGELVLAIPRDPRQRLVAVVRPGGLGPDGFPRVASANLKRGANLGANEVLGRLIEYYGHP